MKQGKRKAERVGVEHIYRCDSEDGSSEETVTEQNATGYTTHLGGPVEEGNLRLENVEGKEVFLGKNPPHSASFSSLQRFSPHFLSGSWTELSFRSLSHNRVHLRASAGEVHCCSVSCTLNVGVLLDQTRHTQTIQILISSELTK